MLQFPLNSAHLTSDLFFNLPVWWSVSSLDDINIVLWKSLVSQLEERSSPWTEPVVQVADKMLYHPDHSLHGEFMGCLQVSGQTPCLIWPAIRLLNAQLLRINDMMMMSVVNNKMMMMMTMRWRDDDFFSSLEFFNYLLGYYGQYLIDIELKYNFSMKTIFLKRKSIFYQIFAALRAARLP